MSGSERTISRRYLLKAKGCGCRWCPDCCRALGMALMERLLPILASFSGVLMMTLTVDPKLFASPEAAHAYVGENQCISLWIRELRKRGYIPSGRYIWFLEFQKSGWPHWHFLIDSKYIPIHEARSVWDSFRPAGAGPVVGNRPGFGSLFFSATRKGSTVVKAAKYCMKYMAKVPDEGFPPWVLAKSGVRRFRASRGFWGVCMSSPAGDPVADECERSRRTAAEIVASCKSTSFVVAVEEEKEGGAVLSSRYVFVGVVPVPLARAAELAGVVGEPEKGGFFLDGDAFARLSGQFGMRDLDRERCEVPVVVVPERFAAMRERIEDTARIVGDLRAAGAFADLRDVNAEIEWRCGCFDDLPPESEVVRRRMRKELVEKKQREKEILTNFVVKNEYSKEEKLNRLVVERA